MAIRQFPGWKTMLKSVWGIRLHDTARRREQMGTKLIGPWHPTAFGAIDVWKMFPSGTMLTHFGHCNGYRCRAGWCKRTLKVQNLFEFLTGHGTWFQTLLQHWTESHWKWSVAIGYLKWSPGYYKLEVGFQWAPGDGFFIIVCFLWRVDTGFTLVDFQQIIDKVKK